MPVPYDRDIDTVIFTDRHGEIPRAELAALSEADRDAIGRLQRHCHDETAYAAKRADGTYGLILAGIEYACDGPDFLGQNIIAKIYEGATFNGNPSDGLKLPSREDVVAEMQTQATIIQDAFPGLELEVCSHKGRDGESIGIRAFVPEASIPTTDIHEIRKAYRDARQNVQPPTLDDTAGARL